MVKFYQGGVYLKEYLLSVSVLLCMIVVVGCNDPEKIEQGEFLLGEFGADFKEQTYHLVVPIEWTGESPIEIKSIQIIKDNDKPVTKEEDGIEFKVFGADPLKQTGIYSEPNIGEFKDIKDIEIDGEAKLVFKFSLKDVKKDNNRRLKIQFNINQKESEQIVVWKTLEQLATDSN